MLIINVFLIVVTYFVIGSSSLYCYWNTGCPYKYFSVKTPYDLIRGDFRDAFKQKGCEPVSIWGLFKNGHKNPGSESADRMQNAMKLRKHIIESKTRGKSSLCAQDIENLRNWNQGSSFFAKPDELSEQGRKQMNEIAKRFKEAYTDFISDLKKEDSNIISTEDNWVKDSAKAFVEGLSNSNIDMNADESGTEDKMKYINCLLHRNDSKTYADAEKYRKNVEYLAARDRIQRRTGITYDLTFDNMTALYDLCRYQSTAEKFSPWCAIFTTEDLQILEYEADLIHFYANDFEEKSKEKFAAPIKDLMNSFQLAKNQTRNKFTAYFDDGSILNMVYKALGLFEDSFPLSGAKRVRERLWRTSINSAFGVNLVVFLNRCKEEELPNYTVSFLLNEEPLSALCDRGVCTWDEFESLLTPFVNVTDKSC